MSSITTISQVNYIKSSASEENNKPLSYAFGFHSIKQHKLSFSAKKPETNLAKIINGANALSYIPVFSTIISVLRIAALIFRSLTAKSSDSMQEKFEHRAIKLTILRILPELIGCGFLLAIPDLVVSILRMKHGNNKY